MRHYSVCGLSIASPDLIPGLHPTRPEGPIDVVIIMVGAAPLAERVNPLESVRYRSPEQLHDGAPLLTVWTGRGGHRLRYAEGAEFLVDRAGTRVEARWEPSMTAADAAIYLLGPVLGFLLRLRGLVPLHASAVEVDGRGVVFVGDAGAGKSTIAATFFRLGYTVLADDVVRIAESGGDVVAYPSQPRISLWPDAVAALFGTQDALPTLTPTYSKRSLDLGADDRFERQAVPVEVIYLLGERTLAPRSPDVRPVAPRTAMMGLVGNTYCNYLLDTTMRATEFDVVSRIASRVPIWQITFSDDISQLSQSCQALVRGAAMIAAVCQ